MDIASRQTAKLAGRSGKMAVTDNLGVRRALTLTSPAVFAAAVGDVLVGPTLPKGSRLLLGSALSCAAGASGSTCDVGLRVKVTGEVLDQTAIATGVPLGVAAVTALTNGSKVAGGIEYLTPHECEVIVTFTGAAPAANQAIRVGLEYVEGA